MSKNNRICVVTGGTGGHIFPAITAAKRLQTLGNNCLIIADNRFLNYIQHINDIQYSIVMSSSLSGSIIRKILSPFKIAIGVLSAMVILYKFKPKLVISFGGYISFPSIIAAFLLRIPTLIHEQNTVMGKTNRILTPFADYITTSFEDTQKLNPKHIKKVHFTGPEVKTKILEIAHSPYPPINTKGKDKINILIIGGSQGSTILSRVIPESISRLSPSIKSKLHITQQCKKEDLRCVNYLYKHNNISAETNTFFGDMEEKFASANLVISRSGASTVSEIIASARPAIFIPLAIATDNHQYFNAKTVADKSAAWIIEEKYFNAESLYTLLSDLIEQNPSKLKDAHQKLLKERKHYSKTTTLIDFIKSI